MASHASARRYARALFDVVIKSGDPLAAIGELRAKAALLAAHPDLRRVLTGVDIPVSAKAGVMRELIRLQPVSPLVARLLLLLIENDDVDELELLAEDFERRVMDLHQIVRVEVTTAIPLGADREQALRDALARVTGRQVRLVARVEPEILAGVVAKVGSRVFDGSIARHLERVRERLIAGQTV
jgi:F-type H+-transporting ATPase subunit delta